MTTVEQISANRGARQEKLAIEGGPKTVSAPLKERWKAIRLRDLVPIARHVHWGQVTDPSGQGYLRTFEEAFAALVGARYALSMNSGTAALHSALFAVGVGPGDEVILPSYTWHATASSVLCCGAKPVFCDIDARTLTADPADIARRITPRTKAILVVHVWGNPCKMDAIKQIADQHGLALIEDCSHAHGAIYQGRAIGTWGDIGCFSMQGGKAVSAGEGGVAVCAKPEYIDRMVALGHPVRSNTRIGSENYNLAGTNLGPKYRPHLFGILWAGRSLARLDALNNRRRRNWQILCDSLAGCEHVYAVETLPGAIRGGFLEFKFVVDLPASQVEISDMVAALKAEGAPFSSDRYGQLHRLSQFQTGGPLTLDLLRGTGGPAQPEYSLPETESLQGRILTLPAYVDVAEDALRQCALALRKVAGHFAQRQGVSPAGE